MDGVGWRRVEFGVDLLERHWFFDPLRVVVVEREETQRGDE
jgi:hypothetical protein